MPSIGVRPVRWLSDDVPGWLEVELVDAAGREWCIRDKAPVLGIDRWDDAMSPLAAASVECVVVADVAGSPTLVIELSHGVESTDGVGRFEVRRDQVAG